MADVALQLNEGTSEYMLSELDGMRVFKKIAPPQLKSSIRKIDRKITQNLLKNTVLSRHIVQPNNYSELITKEAKTLNLWSDYGINTVPVIAYDSNTISFKHLNNATSVRDCIETKTADCHGQFLDVYDSIRSLAQKHKNSDMLHSDPHLENFLYNHSTKIVHPIDPAIHLNPKMTFEELDRDLVIRTLKAYHDLKVPQESKCEYIRDFKETLSAQDIDYIVSMDTKTNIAVKTLFGLREEVAYRVKERTKNKPLNGAFEFGNHLDGYIKEILME